MVKLSGPCLSLEASGSIARALTFASWRRRPYAKAYARPRDTATAAQVGHRCMMGFLQQTWSSLTPAEKATWESLPNPFNLAPYHLYVQFNLVRWKGFLAPSKTCPPTRVAPWAYYGGWSASTNLIRTVKLGVKLTTLNQGWGIIIYRSTSSGFTPSPQNAIMTWRHDSGVWKYFLDAPLASGTYYYRFSYFSVDGKLGTSGTQRTGIAL